MPTDWKTVARRNTIKHLGQLKGKTVHNVVVDSSQVNGLGEFFGLEFTDGTLAWILMDPEGNGPGHLNIETP